MQFTGTMGSRTLKTEHAIDPRQPWLCRTSCNLTKNGEATSILVQKADVRCMYVCMYVFMYVVPYLTSLMCRDGDTFLSAAELRGTGTRLYLCKL